MRRRVKVTILHDECAKLYTFTDSKDFEAMLNRKCIGGLNQVLDDGSISAYVVQKFAELVDEATYMPDDIDISRIMAADSRT